MATLTIKNLPDEIYVALGKAAKKHRRSINSEAIVCLEQSVLPDEADVEATLEGIRKMRSKLHKKGVWLTDEILEQAKNEGRP
jgi:plasmid stability protein